MTLIRLFILCVVSIGFVYLPVLLGIAGIAAPHESTASIMSGPDGRPVGSRFVAQEFTRPEYFHPRPSAADYDGMGAAGSNLSPTHPAIAERASAICAEYEATPDNPIPADLVTASGSGLDPDITIKGAIYQIPRITAARRMESEKVRAVIDQVKRPLMGSFGGPELVNVLKLNLALDANP
jgi:K+-transporting ATPase ATPase C chain